MHLYYKKKYNIEYASFVFSASVHNIVSEASYRDLFTKEKKDFHWFNVRALNCIQGLTQKLSNNLFRRVFSMQILQIIMNKK